jgi:hypothetical protein
MSQPAKKKAAPASKSRKDTSKKRPEPAKNRSDDSDDIERAVYDGMQDLRTTKPK